MSIAKWAELGQKRIMAAMQATVEAVARQFAGLAKEEVEKMWREREREAAESAKKPTAAAEPCKMSGRRALWL